ncbi:MAG: Gfo/Idh/MocA family oxidoreductase [Chloroflexi bacterium]|nr:Gfo/Idh/MocA family oxidoreductase [Chloroflexota bacterium]
MSQRKLRVGVIGAGQPDYWGARAHVPAFRALPNTEVVAVCTTRRETAEAAAQRMGIPRAYWDVLEMVASPDIDLVSVAVRVSQHHSVTMPALEAGKHVFCEWPLALDSGQASEMLALASRKGVRHAMGTQARFAPGILYLKDLLDGGSIGRPLVFSMTQLLSGAMTPRPSHRWWLTRQEEGGTALTIPCGHATDALRWCLGEVASVCGIVDVVVKEGRFADTGERVSVTSPDTVLFLCRLRNGLQGTVNVANTCLEGSGWRLEVYGSEGKLVARGSGMVQYTPIRLSGARRGEREQELPIPQRYYRFPGLAEESPVFNVAQLLQEFTSSIEAGAPFHPDFGDALQLHHILEAVARSSQVGWWVEVPGSPT